jgi:hypothetical protein
MRMRRNYAVMNAMHVRALLTAIAALAGCSADCSDRDGDGLCDAWEIAGGIDLNGDGRIDPAHDLVLAGADPDRPDIYLHVDYMAGHGRNHRPDARAVDAVVQAFARRGIALHVDIGRALPYHQVITFEPILPACNGPDAVNVYDLKKQYFDPKRRLAYHYAVFADYLTCASLEACAQCPAVAGALPLLGATGRAELPGDDFVVTLGVLYDMGLRPTLEQQAGVLMHELGHNLGLKHGGDSHTPDFKPNYLSVAGTFGLSGIPLAAARGSIVPMSCERTRQCPGGAICAEGSGTCVRIDYSGEALPTLDESALNENAGINAGTADITSYVCPDLTVALGAASGPIDWNCNGDAGEPSIAADVSAEGKLTPLTGYDDWANLKFRSPSFGDLSGAPGATALRSGPTIAEARRRGMLFPPRAVELAAVAVGTGELAVAVLGAETLDAYAIDADSLKVRAAAPIRVEFTDVNSDARPDLVVVFATREPGPIHLTGRLRNAQRFAGELR